MIASLERRCVFILSLNDKDFFFKLNGSDNNNNHLYYFLNNYNSSIMTIKSDCIMSLANRRGNGANANIAKHLATRYNDQRQQ